MSVIDVTPQQSKQSIGQKLRHSWDAGLNRLFFDYVKKGLQVGSIFGTFLVLPYTIYRDMKNLKVLSPRRLLQKQAAALTIGIGASLFWMMIRYISWSNKEQKLHDETYYMPGQLQSEFDYVATIWGGATFILTFIITKKLVLAFGAMSPVIALGICQSMLNRNFKKD